ncbi:uncharacterized protein [Argopecten irradians]|uniref:uncharacterized protein isoform X2 n=1 Tax=Argopecten irradians TaxID=31199 RepID=UPI0037161C3F
MGRKDKTSNSSKSKLEAEKQFFQARLSNPNGGGALLVGKDTKLKESPPKHGSHIPPVARHTHDDSSSTSMSDSDDSPRKASQGHTRPKRKRRCKRGCKRSKVTSKTQNEKAAAAQHLKAAHDIRDALLMNESAEKGQEKISLITLNRLTNKVGLFNKGKKSETISRDIHVSDTVKKKTEDDLKNILNNSDENAPPVAIDIVPPRSANLDNFSHASHENILSSASAKLANLIRHSAERTHIRSGVLSSGDHSRLSSKMSITPMSAGSCKSPGSCGSEDKMPESPPYEEIAEQLMHTVKPSLVFPGRRILEETREELQKLFRQNAPRSATPTPNLLKLGSKCTGSVKRSLLERFPPAENSQPNIKGCPNLTGTPEKTTCMETEPRISDITKPERKYTSTTSNIVTDAQVLLKCNDLAISESEHRFSPLPSKEKIQNFNPDARNILRHNDSERAKKIISQSRHCDMDEFFHTTSHTMDSMKQRAQLQLQKDIPQAFHSDIHLGNRSSDHLRIPPDVYRTVSMDTEEYLNQETSQHDSQSSINSLYSSKTSSYSHLDGRSQTSSYSHLDGRSLDYHQGAPKNKAVVTELRHHPEQILRIQNAYYSNSLDYTQSTHQMKEPMDFLDMLDDPQPKAKSPVAAVNMLKSATPDSDGSPLWLPVPPPFPKKPTFDTPSPPDKLYPRLLY